MSNMRKYRIIVLAALVSLFSNTVSFVSSPHQVLAYSCGSSLSAHCYAAHNWNGGTTGAEVFFKVVQLGSADTAITNEQWLVERNSIGAPLYWVEAGYIRSLYYGAPQQKYFFGDKRPGYSFELNYQAVVPAADYGHTVKIKIWKNAGSFSVVIDGYTYWQQAYSTPNGMDADQIQIGQELAGSSGGSAPTTYFTGNKWRDNSTNWHYQTRDGDYSSSDNPPYGSWLILPSQSSLGGSWQTSCC